MLTAHPTVKPVGLVADVIRYVTLRGEGVVDTFAGSGTALVQDLKASRSTAVSPVIETGRVGSCASLLTGGIKRLDPSPQITTDRRGIMSDFKDRLVAQAKMLATMAPKCTNEEQTKQYLVLPFLQALGYNVFDPHEVVPEHHADFSDKYKNRVDYAIFKEGQPIIAIECKPAGAAIAGDRGQLRSYFNACLTVKMAILTNGMTYECYADTDKPNVMDDEPFLSFDLADVAVGKTDKRVLIGIEELRRDRFDPANVGTEARRKLMLNGFVDAIGRWLKDPSDDVVKLLLDDTNFKGMKTAKVLTEAHDLARSAFATAVDRAIIQRMGVTDVAKALQAEASIPGAPPASADTGPGPAAPDGDGVITTETEIKVFEYACRRLAFLVKDEAHWKALDDIRYQDHKTTFRVFYKRPNIGGLFNLTEKKDGTMVFFFPALDGRTVETKDLAAIDDALKESFLKRVAGE